MPVRSAVESSVIPPPVGGWNTKDPISGMDPIYSPEIENWFPNGSTVDLRKGCRQHAKSLGVGIVPGVFEYVRSAGTVFIIGFINGKLYDATSSGAATDISGAAILGGNSASAVNFSDRIFIKTDFNTSDVVHWQGTGNVTLSAFTGPGGDDKNLWQITSYKGRLYFAQIDAPVIWYAGLGFITGALTALDLSTLFRKGGRIFFLGSIAQTGFVNQEIFVVISERGEILTYQGDDPGAANWTQLGRYFIGDPAGKRAFFYWGNDIIIITRDGLVSLTEVIAAGTHGQFEFLSDKISPSFRDAITTAVNISALTPEYVVGAHYPAGNQIVINIPLTSTTAQQFVMNTLTGAWTKFTNMNASHWATVNSILYFGTTNGKIFKADFNTSDTSAFDEDPASEGNAATRTTVLRHAFNYFQDVRNVKQFTDARPIINASNGLTIKSGMDVDYTDTTSTSTFTDTTDTTYKLYQTKLGLTGIGKAGSYRIDDISIGRVSLQATEIFFNKGDVA